ncbi:unnamed protein product [Prunus armeniaca]|uniref:Uncharacterized protein n=1 Tax=Prunus armeniaca TaxID=36596 RepID=A0A6J5WRF0_PRUAR|nr:unnamed protein product [Prunus armeniaca]
MRKTGNLDFVALKALALETEEPTNQAMTTYFQNLSNQNLLNPSYAGDEKLASYPEPHPAPPTPPPGAKMMMYLNQASYAARSLL